MYGLYAISRIRWKRDFQIESVLYAQGSKSIFFGSREEFIEVTSSSKDYLGSCTTRVKTYALDTAIVLRTIASLFPK